VHRYRTTPMQRHRTGCPECNDTAREDNECTDTARPRCNDNARDAPRATTPHGRNECTDTARVSHGNDVMTPKRIILPHRYTWQVYISRYMPRWLTGIVKAVNGGVSKHTYTA